MPKKSHSRKHGKRGGAGAYSSAASYGSYVNGSGDSQWNRVFTGANLPNGNEIIGAQGQNSTIPPSVASSGKMTGGKRRTKKGGFWGQVISQALVPFGLWGLQNRFSRRKGLRSHKKTRRHH
jgi:hypothetical protein